MAEHEDHTFAEEQESSGRLILGPCLECDMPALEGLSYAKGLLAESDAKLREARARAWQEGVNFGVRLGPDDAAYANPYREEADHG